MSPRMKVWRARIGIGAVIAAGIGFLFFRRVDDAERAVAETRLELRKQGFKTDLGDFDLSTPWATTNIESALAALHTERGLSGYRVPFYPMEPVGPDAAIVCCKESLHFGGIPWPVVAAALNDQRALFDDLRNAVLSGPIRLNVHQISGFIPFQPSISTLTDLDHALALAVMVELHNDHRDEAWTNLLASTRLVTNWKPQPLEEAHLRHFSDVEISYDILWQALQAGGWPDDRLAQLQREWESVDFFQSLPETAAFDRAIAASMCEWFNRQPPISRLPLATLLKTALHSPRTAWPTFMSVRRYARYCNHGIFEDEMALMLFYRDRELDMRHAVKLPTWLEMRHFPGATNLLSFHSQYGATSALQGLLNTRQTMLSLAGGFPNDSRRSGGGRNAAQAGRHGNRTGTVQGASRRLSEFTERACARTNQSAAHRLHSWPTAVLSSHAGPALHSFIARNGESAADNR